MKGRKTGGRRKGTPNRVTAEARAVCAQIVNDPAYQKTLRKRARDGTLSPGTEAMLWAYAFAKPTDKLQVGGLDDQPMTVRIINRMRSSSGGAG